MPIYEVGYSTCEESEYLQLHHEQTFTPKQLQDIVQDCMVAVLKKIVRPKSAYKHSRSPSVQDVFGEFDRKHERVFFRHELEKRGFTKIKVEAGAYLFGWASAIDHKDWDGNTSENHKKSVKGIRKKFLKVMPNYLEDVKIGEAREKKEIEVSRKKRELREKRAKAEQEREKAKSENLLAKVITAAKKAAETKENK
jgi:hypothetical protein